MSAIDRFFHHATFAALIVLAMGIFTSITLCAISHILFLFSGLYFFCKFLRNKKWILPPKVWGLVALGISCILSVFANWEYVDNPFYHLSKNKYFLVGLLSWFALQDCYREYLTAKKIKILISLFLFFTTLASFSGLVEVFWGINPVRALFTNKQCHPERACGLFGQWMSYAYGINFFVIMVVGLLLYQKELKDYLNLKLVWIAFFINTLGLFFSYTRGAWIGVLVGIPCFFFKKNKIIFLISILMGCLILCGGIVFNEKIKETFTSFDRMESVRQRISFYHAAWRAFEEKPVLGYGYRNFEPNMVDIKKKYGIAFENSGGHAHNNFLEHLASTGFIGALSFLLFSLLWLVNSYKREDVVGKITFPVVVSFIVSGMFQYTFGDGENVFFIMLLWAL